ncbi:hypothetical protein B2J88_52705, partial [Rhodococcus sp. SRB_17]|nr:hypothetical protein [Rhodococcus sp. SRB_17]
VPGDVDRRTAVLVGHRHPRRERGLDKPEDEPVSLRVRVAGILAAGALTTAVAGAFSGALALAAPPAHATPAEDCEAVRARDHQIYLNMIAALPPGSPIP